MPNQNIPDAGNLTKESEDEISLLDLLLVISENIKLLILGPVIAGLLALGYSFTIAPSFTARTTILPPSGAGGGAASAILDQLGPLAGAAGISGGGPSSAIMAYLDSDTLRDKLIAKFDLKAYYKTKTLAQARLVLKNSTKVASDKKSNLIVVEVSDASPVRAAEIANFYVDAVKELMGTVASQNARIQRELFERQIEDALRKPYQSPIIRDAVIQGLIRQAEMARLEELRRDGPLLTQVDIAQPPEVKSGPKKSMIAIVAALGTGFMLLILVFLRSAIRNVNQDSESARKLERIRKAFSLKS